MKRYAAKTKVPADRSRNELENLLQAHGATQRAIFFDDEQGMVHVQFRMTERMVKISFTTPPKKEQETRQAWRACILIVKAKLEYIASGASTVEREFLADILTPDGRTVHQLLAGQVAQMFKTGKLPPLLGAGSGT
jgi:L-rhamnose mutarotase